MARKYQLQFAKGAPIDEHFLSFVDSLFTELGLSPELAQRAADKWQGYVGARMAADAANIERQVAAIKAEHGAGYTTAVAAGQRAVASLGLSREQGRALEAAIGLPAAAALLIKVGQRLDASAAPAPGNSSSTSNPLSSPEQARAEIDRLSRDPEWHAKLFDKNAAGHAEAKQSWAQLHAAAWPASEPSSEPAAAAPVGLTPKEMFNSLPQDVRDAVSRRDSGGNAKARIEELIGNDGFMASLRDPSHSEHATNRKTFDALHAEAGIKG